MLEKVVDEPDLFLITPPHPWLPQLRLTLIILSHVRDDPLCALNDSAESRDREESTAKPVVHEEEASDVGSNSDNRHDGIHLPNSA